MPANLASRRIAILATHGFEQSELVRPMKELRADGAQVDVVSFDSGPIRGWDGDDWGDEVEVTVLLSDAKAEDYDALVLPGGQINPDLLRVEDEALSFVKRFAHEGKPVAAICHAPWLLAETGLAAGRQLTCYQSIRTDLANAGGQVVDKAVVVCDRGDFPIITSRTPDDLPAFIDAIRERVEQRAAA